MDHKYQHRNEKKNWHRICWIRVHRMTDAQIDTYKVHKHDRFINPLTPNDPYRGRNAPLTSKRCILYIYSTNIGTVYFKCGIYSPFFSSSKCSLFHNSNVLGSCIIHILYTGCAKTKKKNSGAGFKNKSALQIC